MKRIYKSSVLGLALTLAGLSAQAQVKVGDNPTTLAPNTAFQVEKGGSSMVVDNSGNVGIGVLNPVSRFEVRLNGGTGGGLGQGIRILNENAFTGAYFQTATNSAAQHPFVAGLRTRGTLASPTYPVAADILGMYIGRDGIDGATNGIYGGAHMAIEATQNMSATDKGSRLLFSTTPNGAVLPAERMTINHDGNVGVGTAVPSAKLDVRGAAIVLANEGSYTGMYTIMATNNGDHPFTAHLRSRGTLAAKSYPIAGDVLGSYVARDGIDGTGTNPALIGGAAIQMVANENFSLGAKGTDLQFVTTASGTANPQLRMLLSNNGNVGIGTATPTEKLHVWGNVLASNVSVPSDARFKQDVRLLTGSLNKISQLRGVTYTHTAKAVEDRKLAKGTQVGFIAQELEAVFPQFVLTGSDGYKAVDYARLTPVLVEAVKELSAKNAELSARVNELEGLKAEMASIKAMLQSSSTPVPLNSGK